MNKKRTNWVALCVVTVTSVMLLGAFTGSTLAGEKTLKVGIIMPLSGPISFVGVGLTRAVRLYFDKVNEEGGLELGGDTYMIDLIAEDSKTDPTVASTATKKLVYKDEANFVFGAITPPVAAAIYQVCERAKALHIITWIDAPATPGDVSPQKHYAIRLNPTSDTNWEMNYDFLKENYPQAKRLFIVAPDVGLPIETKAKKLAEERGLTLVGHNIWPIGIEDFTPYYTKALATNPDIIQGANSAQAGFQLRTARQLGFKGIFISDSPLAPAIILSIVGKEGSHDVLTNGMDFAHPTPGIKESMDRWAKVTKDPYFEDTPVTYAQAEAFVQALKKANSVKVEKVIAAFESMTAPGSFNTCWGPAHMSGKKTFGVNRVLNRPVPQTRLMNGKIEFLGLKMPALQ
ncbi:MAG: ABC transporter substrate-binding protein [Deltaproteobacteria bacterium]|nr:MAG: ABC transporter substrate-binding protein [Deltaproteobacteria bacterium]